MVMGTFVLEYRAGREFLARLDHGEELMDQILSVASGVGIRSGVFEAVGALQQTELGYYDQNTHEYRMLSVDQPTELVSCSGNISVRDEKPFVHAHAALATSSYEVIGGHLHSGVVFAAELHLKELLGEAPVRLHDGVTDLYLWRRP